MRLAACRKVLHGFLKSLLRDISSLIMAHVKSSHDISVLLVSSRVSAQRSECCLVAQATSTQQAEMKKVKGLQEKLGTELTKLSQRMADLQVQGQKYEAVDGAKNQVNKASRSPNSCSDIANQSHCSCHLSFDCRPTKSALQSCASCQNSNPLCECVLAVCKAEDNWSSHAADWLPPAAAWYLTVTLLIDSGVCRRGSKTAHWRRSTCRPSKVCKLQKLV